MSSVPRLEFSGLAGGYGDVVVVRGIAGAVAAGEVLCVIGRNGVGKSTLLKLLFGQLPCRAGSVRFEGRAIDAVESARRRALGISYCPQERPVFDDLSVRDNLTLMRADRSLDAFAPFFARFPILERRLEQHAGTLSGGEKKILSFVRGLSEAQPLLLLDEPSEGVQWENIVHMAALIDAAKGDGPRPRRRRAEPGVRRARRRPLPRHRAGHGRARGQARRDRSPDAARAPAGLAASGRPSQSSGGRSFFRTSGSTGFCR